MVRSPPRPRHRRYRPDATTLNSRSSSNNNTLQRLARYNSKRWSQRFVASNGRSFWFYFFTPLLVVVPVLTTLWQLNTHAMRTDENSSIGTALESNSKLGQLDQYRIQAAESQSTTKSSPIAIAGSQQANSNPRQLSVTAYVEPSTTLDSSKQPLPLRTTTESRLKRVDFRHNSDRNNRENLCANSRQHELLPVDHFPDDPFLPWIHDYVTTQDGSKIRFVAQNKRRCETGEGKEIVMKFWEPQIALLQGVAVVTEQNGNIRLTADLENSTAKETRFMCHFHGAGINNETTFSEFDFNYEYVLWRKAKLPMFKKTGPDVSIFETSQLLFSCPVPEHLQSAIQSASPPVYIDIVPIRTPARDRPWLTSSQVGPSTATSKFFDASTHYGEKHVLPKIEASGRWANLPVCPAPLAPQKKHRLVACTWTSSTYNRRGDSTQIDDSAERLREWIVFHKLVGVDQIYVYDNTQDEADNSLKEIADSFPYVTYHRWPASVCSNNRPNFKNPGERSSQYAADASCRVRYGDSTEWMAFIDTDEYLVPANHSSWHDVLDSVGSEYDVLKMRSSRGRPRIKHMEVQEDQSTCTKQNRRKKNLPTQPCVGRKKDETFLKLYNCDYIRHPRPDRFSRAMKQIYRPSQVLSHFVHYSTVTKRVAQYFGDSNTTKPFRKAVFGSDYRDIFLDELTQGSLLHAKTVLPHETNVWAASCKNASKHTCAVGLECPASTEFFDDIHQKNLFHDKEGNYCNCWADPHVEEIWLPQLEKALAEMSNKD